MTISTAVKTTETTDTTLLQMIRSAATKLVTLFVLVSLLILSNGCSIRSRNKAIKIPEKRVVRRVESRHTPQTPGTYRQLPQQQPDMVLPLPDSPEAEIEEKELTTPSGLETPKDRTQPHQAIVAQASCLDGLADYRESTASSEIAERLFFMRRALKVCSSDPFYHLELAKLYDELGRVDDAEHERSEARRLAATH